MILIVFMAVVTRKLFGFVFAWSEEVTLLCLTWFTFMGIAIGFRERLHLGMDLFEKLPKKVLDVSDKLIDLVTFFFGLYLVVYGWDFALTMRGSILAATELPNLIQYIVMPITGILTCAYSALQFFERTCAATTSSKRRSSAMPSLTSPIFFSRCRYFRVLAVAIVTTHFTAAIFRGSATSFRFRRW